jgi:formyl-CoA transferase
VAPLATGPLSDVRVVELGNFIAGPFCGQLLGDFGAEVIKVEDPAVGDPMRAWGQETAGGASSLAWPIIARNKKSITCNLRTTEGQDLVRRLVAQSDILIENFRPGTLERWNLGYEELDRLNPRLVLVRVTGYGQTGPYAQRAGFGAISEAMGGLRYLTGSPDRPPSRTGVSLGDSLAATYAALGAVMALHSRSSTGRGQVVDCAIYEAVLTLMESLLPEWHFAGHQRERTGSVLPGVAPSNAYGCLDDVDILIAANGDGVFRRLCAAMGEPELADRPEYSTHKARGQHQKELDDHIESWSKQRTSDEVLAILEEHSVPSGRIYRAVDMFQDPHFAGRDAIVWRRHEKLGDFPMQNVFPRLSRTTGQVNALGPELGEHNAEIYAGLLGLDAAEIERLQGSGVI